MAEARARERSRYASDAQVRRAFRLAAEAGIAPAGLKLGADGSIEIFSKRTAPAGAGSADDALANWEAEEEIRKCREAIAQQGRAPGKRRK